MEPGNSRRRLQKRTKQKAGGLLHTTSRVCLKTLTPGEGLEPSQYRCRRTLSLGFTMVPQLRTSAQTALKALTSSYL